MLGSQDSEQVTPMGEAPMKGVVGARKGQPSLSTQRSAWWPRMSRAVLSRTSLDVQPLGLCVATAGGMGLIPGQGTKTPQAAGQPKKKKNTIEQCCPKEVKFEPWCQGNGAFKFVPWPQDEKLNETSEMNIHFI